MKRHLLKIAAGLVLAASLTACEEPGTLTEAPKASLSASTSFVSGSATLTVQLSSIALTQVSGSLEVISSADEGKTALPASALSGFSSSFAIEATKSSVQQTVTVDPASLEPGSYQAVIRLASASGAEINADKQVVKINLTVLDPEKPDPVVVSVADADPAFADGKAKVTFELSRETDVDITIVLGVDEEGEEGGATPLKAAQLEIGDVTVKAGEVSGSVEIALKDGIAPGKYAAYVYIAEVDHDAEIGEEAEAVIAARISDPDLPTVSLVLEQDETTYDFNVVLTLTEAAAGDVTVTLTKEIDIADENLPDNYVLLYKVAPDLYQFETTVTIPAGGLSASIPITIDTDGIDKLDPATYVLTFVIDDAVGANVDEEENGDYLTYQVYRPLNVKVNTAWSIEYGGRDAYHGKLVDFISVDGPKDTECYIWSIFRAGALTEEDLPTYIRYYESELAEALEEEQEEDPTVSMSDFLYYGSYDWLFNGGSSLLPNGNYEVYMFGFTESGEATGEYQVGAFTVDFEEEEATADYLKWVGTWNIVQEDTLTCTLTITPVLNNAYYAVSGLARTSAKLDATFDKATGDLHLPFQYITSGEDTAFYLAGIGDDDYIAFGDEDNDDLLAVGKMGSNGKTASFTGNSYTYEYEGESYASAVVQVGILGYVSNEGWYNYTDLPLMDVPAPMTLVEDAANSVRKVYGEPQKQLQGHPVKMQRGSDFHGQYAKTTVTVDGKTYGPDSAPRKKAHARRPAAARHGHGAVRRGIRLAR